MCFQEKNSIMYQKSSKAGSRSEISQWNNPEQTVDVSKLNKMGNILILMRDLPYNTLCRLIPAPVGLWTIKLLILIKTCAVMLKKK